MGPRRALYGWRARGGYVVGGVRGAGSGQDPDGKTEGSGPTDEIRGPKPPAFDKAMHQTGSALQACLSRTHV
jgi:hypothetical protein